MGYGELTIDEGYTYKDVSSFFEAWGSLVDFLFLPFASFNIYWKRLGQSELMCYAYEESKYP